MIQTEQLVALDRVAREGSFSRAALALGIGQPAVSARILALEEAVGGTLFVRGRRIRLTALGESFLPFARRALEVLREGVETSRLAQTGDRGPLRFGILGSLAAGLAGPALARFVRAHPRVDCMVRSGDHEFLLQLLADGIVDAALTVRSEALPAWLSAVFTVRERVVLVAHPKHPLARKKRPAPAEVAAAAQPFLKLRWWPAHHPHVKALADQSGISMELAMEAARRLVLDGTGAAYFPATFIAADLKTGHLREVGVPALFRDLALVRPRRAQVSPALAAFIEEVRRETRTHLGR